MAGPAGRTAADNHRRFRALVAFGVLVIAMWFLLDAIEQTQYRAEQQSARLMLNQVRSAMVVRGAEAILTRGETLEQLAGVNPLPLLDFGRGAQVETSCNELAPDKRGWCFNPQQQWLVYQPGQPLLLEGRRREPGAPFIWQVQVDYAAPATQGNNKNKRATGLKLMEIDDHQVSVSQ